MSDEREQAARALRELGTALVRIGKNLRGLTRRQLEDPEVRAALAGIDEVRGVLDQIAALLPN